MESTITNTYLLWKYPSGGEVLVTIADVLDVGCPIDPETGDDATLVTDTLLDEDQNWI